MTHDFTSGPILGKFIRFALPIALTTICEQLLGNTDTLVLGRFVGTSAMAAVGNNAPVLSLIISLLVGTSLGVNVTMAQYMGAGKKDKAREAEHTAILLSLLLGIAGFFLGEFLAIPILGLLDVPPQVLGDAEECLRIFFFALPFLSLYNFEAAIFRSTGDGSTPLISLVGAALLNAVLDLAAVFLGLGLAGVMWASIFSYIACAIFLFYRLTKRTDFLHLEPSECALIREPLLRITRIGLPAGIQGMVFSISNLVIQSAINSLGPEVMAASSAAFTIEMNTYAFVNACGQATTTIVGQNFGARRILRCLSVVRKALGVECILAIVLGGLCSLFAEDIIRLFSNHPDVITYGAIRIRVVTGFLFLNGMIDVFTGGLRGFGFSLPPAIVVLAAICGTRILYVHTIFSLFPTCFILMACYPVSWIITNVLLYIVYKKVTAGIVKNYSERIKQEKREGR